MLLYYSCGQNGRKADTFTKLISLFQEHGFGHRQNSAHLLSEQDVNQDLVESIGQLECLVLLALVDLPGLTSSGRENHVLFKKAEDVGEIDKLVSGLGSHPDHGPVMLAWMLAHYLADGEESLQSMHSLGERGLHLRAVNFLTQALSNEVISANNSVENAASGACYSVLSVLVTAFEPQRMGISADVEFLAQHLFKREQIAGDFWKQGCEVKFPQLHFVL